MSHLSSAEFVDAVEGRLRAGRAAHLEGCAACRARLSEVRAAWEAARMTDVPEPSPIYWQHLAARVRERVETESILPAWRAVSWREYFAVPRLAPAASALILAAAIIAGGLLGRGGRVFAPAPGPMITTPQGDRAAEEAAMWEGLTSAAAEMPIEDAGAAGLAPPSAAIDEAVQQLSPAELRELNRLLQTELAGRGD